MSDYAALLRTILLNPADDTARLVMADWLQENDQESRAEFIRLAIVLNNGPTDGAILSEVGFGGTRASCVVPVKYAVPRDTELLTFYFREPWHDEYRTVSGRPIEFRDLYVFDNKPKAIGVRLDPFSVTTWNQDGWKRLHELWLTIFKKPNQWFADRRFNYSVMMDDASGRLTRGFVSHISLTCAQFLSPGFAADLFGAHPIASVTLTDKEPERNTHYNLFSWNCAFDDLDHGPNDLPRELFRFLPTTSDDHFSWTTTSRQMALDYLSHSCVSYGRAAAHLPPLPT